MAKLFAAQNLIKGKKLGGQGQTKGSVDRWLDTGSIRMDGAMGGGVAVGKVCLLFGDKSGGKTTTAARVAGRSQKRCRNCFRFAHRDAWHIFVGDELVRDGDGEPKEFSRIAAHEYLVEASRSTRERSGAGSEDGAVTCDTKASARSIAYWLPGMPEARIERLPGYPQATPPTDEELAVIGEDARWSAVGYCSCFGEGLYKTDDVPKKEKDEKTKAYNERVAKWSDHMKLNSYEEFVVAWVDVEESYHSKWFGDLGMDNRRVLLVQPTNAEEAIDLCHALAMTNEVDLMIIDSIAQLVPQKEISASMEDWQQGLQARLVNKAIRKLVASATSQRNRSRPITQIWINQTRMKIGVTFGSPIVKPGGMGQDFAAHQEMRFMKSKVKTVTEQYGTKDEFLTVAIEEVINFKNTKSKVSGSKGADGSYTQSKQQVGAYPPGAVMEHEDIFKLAMHFIVDIDKKKNTYTIGDTVFDSQKALLTRLREDDDYFEAIRSRCLERILGAKGSGASKDDD